MIHLNIGHRLREHLFDALRDTHRIKIKVHILDSDEQHVSDFQFSYGSTHLVSGSVNVDTTQDVTRSLQLDILDPRGRLLFTPDTPAEGGIYAEYMVAVEYCVLVPHHNLFPRSDLYPHPKIYPGDTAKPESGTWVDIPVFWGPLTKYTSSGGVVSIEAQGKESLGLAPHDVGQGYTLKKGKHVDDAIEAVLRRIGERKFALGSLPWKLKHDVPVHPQDEAWRIVALGQDDSDGNRAGPLIAKTGTHPHHLFFDGRGRTRAKRLNKEAVHTFDDRWLVSEPEVDYEGLEFVNRAIIRGLKPKGKGKKRIVVEVTLPKENPLSPENLKRHGKKKFRTVRVDTDLDDPRKCRQRGIHILRAQAKIDLDASFETLPNPLLEEHDVIRAKTDAIHVEFPLRVFTLPLTSADAMTIGYTKRVSSRPRVRGQKNHRKLRGRGAAGPPGGRGAGAATGGSGGAGNR